MRSTFLFSLFFLVLELYGQEINPTVPALFFQKIPEVAYENADIRLVIKNLAQSTRTNIQLHPGIASKTSIRLYDKPLIEILELLARNHSLQLTWRGDVLLVDPLPVEIQVPVAPEPSIRIQNSMLTLEAEQVPTTAFIRRFIEVTGKNLIAESGLPPTVTGYVQNLPVNESLKLFFLSNQIKVSEKEGVFFLEPATENGNSKTRRLGFNQIQVKDSLITIDVRQSPIDQLIKEAATQLKYSVIYYSDVQGQLTASFSGITFDSFLSFALRNTQQTWKKDQGIYFIGDRNNRALITTQLILLNNRKVEKLPELIPPEFQKNITIKEIKEQNGLLVTGTQNDIDDIQSFVRSIDFSTPQVLIEALVVDFSTSDGVSTGVTAATGDTSGTRPDQFLPGMDFKLSSKNVTQIAEGIGFTRIGKLPDDFYVRIQALETAGLAKVRSRPMLSTLNGHKASLLVGTTQYYILKSTTPIRDNQGAIITENQQFKEISANISLEITPWVSTSGEVTVEIKPVFESPVGQFSPDIPPTINKRSFESTIRLSDGETVVLGGLIEESESESTQGVPWLSRIPWLGRFFSSSTTITRKSELVIYVTPRVYLGTQIPGQQPGL